MASKTKYRIVNDVYYHRILGRGEKKNSLSIGFEWEMDSSEYDLPLDNPFMGEYYKVGWDCGGWEFSSPITENIATCRRLAKSLIKWGKRHKQFSKLYSSKGNQCGCGIHIHVGNFPNEKIKLMCFENWKAFFTVNPDYTWGISGRNSTSAWSGQAKVSGFKAPLSYTFSFNRDRTIEVRMFGPKPDTLLVAIEFTHSVFTYLKNLKRIVETEEEAQEMFYNYHEWLKQTKGYKILKQNPYVKEELDNVV